MKQAELTLTFKVKVNLDPSEYIHPVTDKELLALEIDSANETWDILLYQDDMAPVVTGVILGEEDNGTTNKIAEIKSKLAIMHAPNYSLTLADREYLEDVEYLLSKLDQGGA